MDSIESDNINRTDNNNEMIKLPTMEATEANEEVNSEKIIKQLNKSSFRTSNFEDLAYLKDSITISESEYPVMDAQNQSQILNDSPDENPENDFEYGKHEEQIYDEMPSLKGTIADLVKFDQENPELINHGTIKALIVQLTSPEIIDYNLIYDFFITYRMFTNSETIMKLLMIRLIWSLQNINKDDPELNKIGKLVLLRTFVVLRHWILNYFIDDFNDNFGLCDEFITILNDIIFKSQLIKSEMVFEIKILKDLKIHWVSLLIEFWDVDMNLNLLTPDILYFKLPLTSELPSKPKKLVKSNTELSIHTNASYRRSAMLSLYDNRNSTNGNSRNSVTNANTNVHKVLVFDDNKTIASENPQLSINNLLIQHQSSRQSIMNKINHFNFNLNLKSNKERNSVSPTNNLITKQPKVEPKSPLKSTNKHNRMNLNDSSIGLKKTTDNYQPTTNSLHKISLNPIQIDNIGFTTNGNIKLPSSKIFNIVPSTPVKKMDYIIRHDELVEEQVDEELNDDTFGKPTSQFSQSEISRKRSLKKILEGWKKSVYHKNQNFDHLINDDIKKDLIGERFDILTARIVDELEFLIRYYIQSDSYNATIVEGDTIDNSQPIDKDEIDIDEFDNSVDLIGSPAKQYHTNTNIDTTLSRDEDEMDINDLSELNIVKIDNLINEENGENEEDDDEEEFKDTRQSLGNNPISPNFVEEIHEFSFQRATSISWTNDEEINFENSHNNESKDSGISLPDPNLNNYPPYSLKNESRISTISTPSNITDYNAEIHDLGIAMSPQSMKDQTKRISLMEKRFSRNSSNSIFRRDSIKSYVSYDSAFSISQQSISADDEDKGLKKKAGIKDLRMLAGLPSERKSLDNPVRILSTSSQRKSIRYSTVKALSELPFNGSTDSKLKRVSVSNSSVFSVAKSRTSIAHSIQTLNDDNSRLSRSISMNNSQSNLDDSKHSIAIPGISNSVLKELAAIPDESFHFNPIESALGKLEGKRSLNGSGSDITHVDDTQDILDEINNANTQDIIESSSMVDFQEESPLTPKTNNEIEPTTVTSDEADNDNVFIFSANYTDSTTKQSYSPNDFNFKQQEFQSPKIILESYNLSSDELNIENIFKFNHHISFILSYSSQELSEHFTIIERDILQEIDWKELIELKWNKDLDPVNSWLEIIVNEDYYNNNKGVNLVISRFNLMVNWIISEILLTHNQIERIGIISRFIHIADHCLKIQNYSTLMQILLALTSEKITKLKETWKSLNPGDILMLKNLEQLSSPLKNFINLRISINQIQPSKGAIPFVGLYLSDLIFNTERPKFIKSQNEPIVNFARFRTSVHIVKSLSQCIEWSSYYNLSIDNELLSKCLYLRSLNEEEMNYCLDNIECP